MRGVKYQRHSFAFPQAEPRWSTKVDRWYQLDAFAFGLADLYVHASEKGALSEPKLILLASPGASNLSDWGFVSTGASSPSKFVHTLPSVRATSLCQVMGWSGPTLCFQRDPGSVVAALEEALGLASPEFPVVWVVGARAIPVLKGPAPKGIAEKGDDFEAYLFEVFFGENHSADASPCPYILTTEGGIPGEEAPEVTDDLLFKWLAKEPAKEGAVLRLLETCQLARSVSFGDTV